MIIVLQKRISKGITVAIVCDRVIALTKPLRYKTGQLPPGMDTSEFKA